MARGDINVVVYVDEEEYAAYSAGRPPAASGLAMRLDTCFSAWDQIGEITDLVHATAAPGGAKRYLVSVVGQLGMDSIGLVKELYGKAAELKWFLDSEALRADAARKLSGHGLDQVILLPY